MKNIKLPKCPTLLDTFRLVDDKIILELKTVEKITDIHKAQALNYLKATGLHLAIIFNFYPQSLEYKRVAL